MPGQIILIVRSGQDDGKAITPALATVGAVIVEAGDAQTALDLLLTRRPVGIIVELPIAGMSCPDFCARVRKAKYRGPILLVIKPDDEEPIGALTTGAIAITLEPAGGGAPVADILCGLLGGAEALTRHRMRRLGNLALDVEGQSVQCGDRDLRLTPSEFALLDHLARCAGQTVPRDALLHTLENRRLPNVEPPGARVVDAHVSKLRVKLRGTSACIKSIYAVGYRLLVEENGSGSVSPPPSHPPS